MESLQTCRHAPGGGYIIGCALPGNFPFLLEAGGIGYRPLEHVAVLHFLLAALLMYFFLRTIDVSRIGAGVGALVFPGNGALLWITSRWIQMQNVFVWLPPILGAVHRGAKGPVFWRWIAVGGVGVALQVLAGYPEYAFYSGLVVAFYPLSISPKTRRRRAFLAVPGV